MRKLIVLGFLFLFGVGPALFAQDSPLDPAAEYKSLSDAYRQASVEFSKVVRTAPPAEMATLYNDREKNPVYKFLPKYEALAAKSKGTEVSFRSWQFVFGNRMRFTAEEATSWERKSVEGILEHVDQDYFAEFVARLGGSGLDPKVTDSIMAKADVSKSIAVRTATLYSRGARLYGGSRDGSDAASKAKGRAILESIQKDPAMSAVKVSNTTYGKRIEGMFFKEDNLSIGKVAPDFEAKDQDDKPWKLSDYRGNVVVVDFWGFW